MIFSKNCKTTILVLETINTGYKTTTVLKWNSPRFKAKNCYSFVLKLQMKLQMTWKLQMKLQTTKNCSFWKF